MKNNWDTLPPRIRALIVFLIAFGIAQLGFLVGGPLETMDYLFGIYAGGFVVYFLARWGFFAVRVPLTLPNQNVTTLEKYRKNPGKRRFGPGEPAEFIDPDEADDELLDDDRVVGVSFNGEAAAYPLAALGVREISNEEYGDTPIIITWSPVTYSARAFHAKANNNVITLQRHTHTVNNSPAMPDTGTSTFVQFIGQAVTGELTGWTLEQIPVVTTTWAAWKEAHPETEVMSTEGGPEVDIFERYYANDRNGIHSLNPSDKRLHGKDVVFGLDIKGESKAYAYTALIDQPLVEEDLGREPIIVLHERSSSTAVAFSRTVAGRTLNFKGKNKNPHRRSPEATASGEGERPDYEAWLIEDTQTGSTWRAISGECIEGELKGNKLEILNGMTGFWYAWSRFYPNAELFEADTTSEPAN
ncbi:DUF3179 domain-containing (seleno)protein [Candidatus Lucifugimonas marina]|uniref:DUF3179 domain-containing protein n=1 Tax=Candidatus Lucifugimonas marina TaxID=3038979 RepID=A0AAJ5ZH14_9CHLR|nr:DUF3179 domain-containing protein [SAR202 cluster bacterium JH702]MDG0869975.1 DUF3179 domain-containing protein [SAR202 cluster bacterium JH639]WFG34698.1 DUF3179 domain-containing protein [SAR202 cluster bacterium JH545]WFG38626.1 DUF3179 domain-containing protein [SAR202 cluster bacterium JH1073]